MLLWMCCAVLWAVGFTDAQARTARKPALPTHTPKTKHRPKPPPPQPIELEHLTTHDRLFLSPSPRGGFARHKMQEVASFLRCHHTGRRHPIHQKLVALLYQVSRHFHGAKLLIVAGYRAPQVARQKGNPQSPHKRGVACDFRVEGTPTETVRDYLRASFHPIGVGYYPNSDFVHLDVGRPKDAFWVDLSGPGEKARYTPWLRRDRGIQKSPKPPAQRTRTITRRRHAADTSR